jgi:hypothetical protein
MNSCKITAFTKNPVAWRILMTGEATNWLPVSDLKKGFNENKLPPTSELAKKELFFYLIDNRVIRYFFCDSLNLSWNTISHEGNSEVVNEKYEAIKIDPGVYFLDFVQSKHPEISISMALNLNTDQALIITTTVPSIKDVNQSLLDRMKSGLDLSPMKVEVNQASINKPLIHPHSQLIKRTADLIGKRIRYIYSSLHTYEHIYLNSRFYCWQCLRGPEKGTADTDRCCYLKIDDHIYLFIWCEKIVPTTGIVLINFKNMRSNGKIFGLDVPSGKPINFTMGACFEVVSEIKNPGILFHRYHNRIIFKRRNI